jgi:hypothetical protein
MSLLKLCQIQRGSVLVDGTEISQARPSIIRERCFIAVPQDAFNQPDESLRDNLDPLKHHSTREIKQALQKMPNLTLKTTRMLIEYSHCRSHSSHRCQWDKRNYCLLHVRCSKPVIKSTKDESPLYYLMSQLPILMMITRVSHPGSLKKSLPKKGTLC